MRSLRAGYRLLALLLLLTLGFVPADQATFATTTSTAFGSLVDGTGDVGWSNDLVIGRDGLGLIAYFDRTEGNVKVAHCENIQCSLSTKTVIDGVDYVGRYLALALGSDGLGVIVYVDQTNSRLKVAHCENIQCSRATITVVTETLFMSSLPTITINAEGFPNIIYQEGYGPFTITFVNCLDLLCSQSTSTLIDRDYAAYSTKIKLGSDNKIFIVYYELFTYRTITLNFVYCQNLDCSINTRKELYTTPSEAYFGLHDVAIGADGYPIISFYDAEQYHLMTAHCESYDCQTATINVVDSNGDWNGQSSSIMIGADGLPLIVYHARQIITIFDHDEMRIAHCQDIRCNEIDIVNLTDNIIPFQAYNFHMRKARNDHGLIIYYDTINMNLRVVHCVNIVCSSVQSTSFEQYLALVQSNLFRLSLMINQQTIPVQLIAQQGQIFYQTTINVPSILPTGGSFVLSADPDGQTPSLVDDAVVFKLNNQEVFCFEYIGSIAPAPTLVTIPNSLVAQWAGQTLTVEFHDRFAGQIQASTMYLVWLP